MPFTDPPPPEISQDGIYYLDYYDGLTSIPPNPDWNTEQYITTFPENLQIDDAIGGTGNCSWQYSFTALDAEGNNVLPTDDTEDFIHPWRSWWRLRCGATVIAAGPVTGTNSKLGEDFVSIAGQSWEAYFPRWQFPFDPRPDHVNDFRYPKTFVGNEDPSHGAGAGGSGANTPGGLAYQANNRDVALIARDLLVQIRDSVNDRLYMNFAELQSPVGIATNFQFTLGDSSGIDSAITTLTGIRDGFDLWVGWDRHVHVGSPYRYGTNANPDIAYTITVDTPGLLSLEYENAGIQGNHVIGRGAGLASQTQLGAAYGYVPSQDEFSRLDIAFDYGDIRNRSQLQDLTKKSLSLIINPIRHVPVTLDPALIPDYWNIFRKGRAIFVAVDTGFHKINAAYRLTGWSAQDNEDTGDFEVNLTLERIYDTVSDFGNPDDSFAGTTGDTSGGTGGPILTAEFTIAS